MCLTPFFCFSLSTMFFNKKANVDMFPVVLVFLLRITCAFSGSTIDDLFPQASKFYEEKFCTRREPTFWNVLMSPKQICDRDISERIEICKGVLQHVFKSSPLTLATKETFITAEESECVDLPVMFRWLPNKDNPIMVHCYRCPLKYSLDSPSVYAVGGLDPKYASFYIAQGEAPKIVYVLHDVIKDENKDVLHSSTVQRSTADVTNDADATSQPSPAEPLVQHSNDVLPSTSQEAEITKAEPATPADELAFHKILADPDRKLFVSRSFKVEKVTVMNSVNYKLIEVPDFWQMKRESA